MSTGHRATPARWLRQVEARSLRGDASMDAAAAQCWDALKLPSQRMALVREIVATRATELTLAYRNVVGVVAGYKSRRNADGAEELHPEPCVIFMVKRKWLPHETGENAQRLPVRLLAYGGDPTQPAQKPARCLYAVPTDVQLAALHVGARSQAHGAVNVVDEVPRFVLPGTLTCGVRLRGAATGESRFAISAMHVLNPVPQQTDAHGGADFKAIAAPGEARGITAPWGGHLDADLGDGFDAQLAVVHDRAWFNDAFAPLNLSAQQPFVAAPDLFDDLAATRSFRIVVHEDQPKHRRGRVAQCRPSSRKLWGLSGA